MQEICRTFLILNDAYNKKAFKDNFNLKMLLKRLYFQLTADFFIFNFKSNSSFQKDNLLIVKVIQI